MSCPFSPNGEHSFALVESSAEDSAHTGRWGGFLRGHQCCGQCKNNFSGRCEGACRGRCLHVRQYTISRQRCQKCGKLKAEIPGYYQEDLWDPANPPPLWIKRGINFHMVDRIIRKAVSAKELEALIADKDLVKLEWFFTDPYDSPHGRKEGTAWWIVNDPRTGESEGTQYELIYSPTHYTTGRTRPGLTKSPPCTFVTACLRLLLCRA